GADDGGAAGGAPVAGAAGAGGAAGVNGAGVKVSKRRIRPRAPACGGLSVSTVTYMRPWPSKATPPGKLSPDATTEIAPPGVIRSTRPLFGTKLGGLVLRSNPDVNSTT